MVRKWWALILLLVVVLMAGCGGEAEPTPVVIATAPPSAPGAYPGGPTVSASGEVVAAQEAEIGFTLAGRVTTVAVDVGDEVQEGDVLLMLETASLEASVAQAEAALDAATAQLMMLEAGPREEEVVAAQAAYRGALAQYRKLQAGPTDDEVRVATAALRVAEAALQQAQAAYDEVAWLEENTMLPQALALEQATLEYERALANYEIATRGAAPEDLQAAWASVESAQAQLNMLLAGATDEEIAAAEAAVAQAGAALEMARVALEEATLRAPFVGTIAALAVTTGETVMPGQAALTLADLSDLQVETTDLSERDVDRVAVGQQATVYVEALGEDVEGRVVRIAPRADKIGGDVVYPVVIELNEQPAALRWGMSVEVEIATDGG
jgi:multidrug efflux pump subunit AcrA (membrane-fusion protein)